MPGKSNVVPRALWAVAAKEQRKRRIVDPWEDVISDAIRSILKRYADAAKTAIKAGKPPPQISGPIREIDHKGRKVWFVASKTILTDTLDIKPAQQHGLSGKRASTVMGRLGWEPERVKLDDHTTRGFIYDPTARGIAAGGWDKYQDALDDAAADDGNKDDATITGAPAADAPMNNPEGNSEGDESEESEDGGEEQTLDLDGIILEDEAVEDEAVVDEVADEGGEPE